MHSIIATLALLSIATKPNVLASSTKLNLNGGWLFAARPTWEMDAGWQATDYDDSKWKPTDVNIGYRARGNAYHSYNYYRLKFQVPHGWGKGLWPVPGCTGTLLGSIGQGS